MSIEFVTDAYRVPGKVHVCAVCQREGTWGEGWMWYGSELDLEEGGEILIICSEGCKQKAEQNGMIKEYKPRKRKSGGHKKKEYCPTCGKHLI